MAAGQRSGVQLYRGRLERTKPAQRNQACNRQCKALGIPKPRSPNLVCKSRAWHQQPQCGCTTRQLRHKTHLGERSNSAYHAAKQNQLARERKPGPKHKRGGIRPIMAKSLSKSKLATSGANWPWRQNTSIRALTKAPLQGLVSASDHQGPQLGHLA